MTTLVTPPPVIKGQVWSVEDLDDEQSSVTAGSRKWRAVLRRVVVGSRTIDAGGFLAVSANTFDEAWDVVSSLPGGIDNLVCLVPWDHPEAVLGAMPHGEYGKAWIHRYRDASGVTRKALGLFFHGEEEVTFRLVGEEDFHGRS